MAIRINNNNSVLSYQKVSLYVKYLIFCHVQSFANALIPLAYQRLQGDLIGRTKSAGFHIGFFVRGKKSIAILGGLEACSKEKKFYDPCDFISALFCPKISIDLKIISSQTGKSILRLRVTVRPCTGISHSE